MALVRGKLGVKKAARQKRCQLPPQVDGSKRTNTMRKITAIAVALGFLTSVSLPAFATPAVNGVVKSDELSAKKKKKKDTMEKKSSLGAKRSLSPPRRRRRTFDGEEVEPRRDRSLRRQEEKKKDRERSPRSPLSRIAA
jgi:hypothetical protein